MTGPVLSWRKIDLAIATAKAVSLAQLDGPVLYLVKPVTPKVRDAIPTREMD